MGRLIVAFAVLALAAPLAAQSGSAPAVTGDLRLRWEDFATPAAAPADRRKYDLTSARLRLNLEFERGSWRIHAAVQGALARTLPEDAVFGAGRSYYVASGGEAEPETADLLELSVSLRTPRFRITAGRQAFGEGFETGTGLDRLDAVKRTRLAERLVGNWEWVNVARRFDGASLAVDRASWNLSGFAHRLLSGGVNYATPLERLDKVHVVGATWTFKRGTLLERTELRIFDVGYRDERDSVVALAGGNLSLHTFGLSLLGGDDANDWLVWAAAQRGSWGVDPQRAWAAFAEYGHQWQSAVARPWLRCGAARASGDPDPRSGERRTFFNVVPTNHKWYGAMDFVAFSNLTTLYAHLLVFPAPRLQLELGVHHFRLTEQHDAWVLGSGPFDNASLGYQRRANASASDRLGHEVDLIATYALTQAGSVEVGGGRFLGGAVVRSSLPDHADGSWLYAQLVWKF